MTGSLLRIAIIAHALRVAGGRTVGLNFIDALQRTAPEHRYLFVIPRDCGYEELVSRFPDSRSISTPSMNFLKRWIFDSRRLHALVAEFRPNVVFGLGGYGLDRPPCPQALFPQDSHLFYPEKHFAGETLRSRLQKRFNRRRLAKHLQRTDLILCQTNVVERRIRSAFGYTGKVYVCGSAPPNGLTRQVPGTTPEPIRASPARFKLLCLSKYSAHKNFEGVIDAFEKAGDRLNDVAVFTTVAPDHHPKASHFLKRLATSKINDRIINVGTLSVQQVGDYLSHVDALLMPTRLETFCLPYVEAMMFRRPIITSDLDFAHAVCDDAAVYFDAWNAGDMARAIIMLRDDPELRRKLGEAGYARQSKLFKSWDEIARETVIRLREIVETRVVESRTGSRA